MKKTLRVLALVLAILCLVPAIVACGNKGKDDNKGGTTADPGTVDTSEGYASKLPAYDWDEDVFYILARDGGSSTMMTNFEIWRENMDGTVVGDAVYTRNENLRKKYNFVVEQMLVSNPYTEAQTLYDAQDDVYDLVVYKPIQVFNHASSGYLLNLYDIMYIDMEHPAWSDYVNQQLTIGGKLFATTNQFLLQDKARTYTMFYNRELARENGLGTLEDHVENNTWTLEVFEQCARTTVFDIDGGGAGNQGDSFGVVAEGHVSFSSLCYGAGFTLGINDGENITLTGATQEMNSIIDAVGKVWFDKTVAAVPSDFTPLDYYACLNIFTAERSLFEISFPTDFDVAGGFNEACNFEFGVLPFPKYNEEQERYYNANNVHNSSVFAIPYTVSDPDQIGFYLEAISEESCNTTYTAYIDSKCKVQDAYDELTAKMLDLCFDSINMDIIACLNPGGIFSIISDQVPSFRTNIFIRLYNSKGDRPQTELDQYIATFEELE